MKQRLFIPALSALRVVGSVLCLVGAAWSLHAAEANTPARRPNILLAISDDQSFADTPMAAIGRC